jgi:predicted kinase
MTETPRPVMVVTIAPPGAGKSTWIGERAVAQQRVNLDTYRGLIADDEGDQTANNEAAAIQGIILGGRLRRGLLTYIDSTNTRAKFRGELLAKAAQFGAFTVAVVWDLPIGLCIDRNLSRDRQVPAEVIERMHLAIRTDIPEGPVPGFHLTRRIRYRVGADVLFGQVPDEYASAPWLR